MISEIVDGVASTAVKRKNLCLWKNFGRGTVLFLNILLKSSLNFPGEDLSHTCLSGYVLSIFNITFQPTYTQSLDIPASIETKYQNIYRKTNN